jgi:xylulokinase
VVTGGAVRHPLWLQLQADIFNRPVYITGAGDGESGAQAAAAGAAVSTARGAALLAGIGAGVYADAREAIRTAVGQPLEAARPDARQAGQYESAYQEYQGWAALFAGRAHSNSRV